MVETNRGCANEVYAATSEEILIYFGSGADDQNIGILDSCGIDREAVQGTDLNVRPMGRDARCKVGDFLIDDDFQSAQYLMLSMRRTGPQ